MTWTHTAHTLNARKPMTRTLIALMLCLTLCLICLTGYAQALPAQGQTLTDMAGRQLTLEAPATRIVALSAADCEILYALGAGDALVGRGAYCDYPAQVLDLPVVNSGEQTNLEEILALDPQVVIMDVMAQTVEQIAALEAAGVKVVVLNAQDIEGVYTAISLIGSLTGKDAAADALITDMKAGLGAIAAKAAAATKADEDPPTVYFEVSPLQWGLWTAGQGTFMDELAALCGLTNAFADVTGWAQISEEQVIARNPDYIVTLTMYYGEGPTPVEEILGRAGWEGLTAVQNAQVFNANSDEISRPGPRLTVAAEALLGFISGETAPLN